MAEFETLWLQAQLDRANDGDHDAWNPIIEQCMTRLETIARRMLKNFPRVRRWEDTNDVVQRAVMRLMRSLKDVPIRSTRDFYGLAATQIRRELLDLTRHYTGAEGLGANYNSGFHGKAGEDSTPGMQPSDEQSCITELFSWQHLHEAVEKLDAEAREVFSLVFYHGWTQPQIAELFQVDERTIRRRWRSVCQQLGESLGDDWAGVTGE